VHSGKLPELAAADLLLIERAQAGELFSGNGVVGDDLPLNPRLHELLVADERGVVGRNPDSGISRCLGGIEFADEQGELTLRVDGSSGPVGLCHARYA